MQGIRSTVWLMVSACFLFVLSACSGEEGSSTSGTASGTIQLALTSSVDPTPTDDVNPTPTDDVNLDPTDDVDPGPTDTTDPDPADAVDPDPTEVVDPDPTEVVDPDPTEVVDPDPTDDAVDPDPTDSVVAGFTEVVISIKEVRAFPAGSEGTEEGELPLIVAFETAKVVNILDLAFLQELLGETVLSVGTYSQLRLVLETNSDSLAPANYIIRADDPAQKIPLHTPSGQESGLKIVGGFTIEAAETTTVLLDFNPAKAVVQAGQSGIWQLKPTGIRVVEAENFLPTYGTVSGRVELEVVGADGTVIRSPITEAMVFAVAPGSDTVIATGAVNVEDGSFHLLLPAGSYELRVTADGFASFSSLPSVFEVLEGEDTDGGTILLGGTTAE